MIMGHNDAIFIAGGHGVAGSAIRRRLLSKGYSNVLSPTHKELDLSSQDEVESFFKEYKPKYVLYTAAKMGSITYRNSHPAELLLENLLMQTNVIRCAHRFDVEKLLFMSSDFIYPEIQDRAMTEDDFLSGLPSKRDFPYSLAKITGVKLCDYYREEYGNQFFTVVPCAFFGTDSSFDLERANVVASMIHRMHDAKTTNAAEFTLWGTGKPVKEFLFSDDVASACVLLMEQESVEGLYNIGSGSGGTSIRELADIIKNVVDYKGQIVYDLSKPDGIMRRVTNSSRLRALGWKPEYDLETAVRITYEHFQKQVG